MKCDEVIERILSAAHQSMKVQKTESVDIIVPPETFAEIMHKLTSVKIDKNYSSGHLGSFYIRSDNFIAGTDRLLCRLPPEPMDLRPGDFLPALDDPEVEKMRKHIENANKKEAE
jgi:hypothetical protein